MKFEYLTCCVSSTARLIDAMVDVARQITYRTFVNRVNIEVEVFGYVRRGAGLKLRDDWAVSFFKSTYDGKPCYYMQHSAIEYIFTAS